MLRWHCLAKQASPGTIAITCLTDIGSDIALPVVPRAQGQLHLVAKRRDDRSVIADFRQQGSMKGLFPRTHGAALDAVFLNTAGGLTGGDRMTVSVEAENNAHVVLSSQAAERVYRAQLGQIAKVDVTLDVKPQGRVDWIPQETILFDGAALDRQLRVQLAPGATALIVEPLVFGRAAMGETVRDLHFTDQWRIYRDDNLIFADAVRIIGDAQSLMQRKATAGGAGAIATVLLAGPTAQGMAGYDWPDACGASLIADDVLLIRLIAKDSFTLRQDLIPIIEALSAAPLPRVWRL